MKSCPFTVERHHIVPKSSGGADSEENLVYLSPREHYVAHKLLYKINPSKENAYALVAMSRMSLTGITRCSSRDVEIARKLAAALSSHRMKENNPSRGKFGKESLKHVGLWVTPFGAFGSCYEAEKATGIGKSTIQRRCRNPEYINNAPRLGKENMGKSWRELGYWFEEVTDSECV